MKWLRGRGGGYYESEDAVATLTFIPGHWEVVIARPFEEHGEDVFDCRTLREAKASYEPEEE